MTELDMENKSLEERLDMAVQVATILKAQVEQLFRVDMESL